MFRVARLIHLFERRQALIFALFVRLERVTRTVWIVDREKNKIVLAIRPKLISLAIISSCYTIERLKPGFVLYRADRSTPSLQRTTNGILICRQLAVLNARQVIERIDHIKRAHAIMLASLILLCDR